MLCVGARSNLDDAAAAVLSQLLERRGIGARWASWSDTRIANLARWDVTDVQIVCLLYLNENSLSHARYLIRRIKRRMPTVQILGAFLSLSADTSRLPLIEATKADLIATSLSEVLDRDLSLGSTSPKMSSVNERTVRPVFQNWPPPSEPPAANGTEVHGYKQLARVPRALPMRGGIKPNFCDYAVHCHSSRSRFSAALTRSERFTR